ncbi:UNVERIFIED_CONTAM: hypothetical protein RF653_05300 [Kocuria sp. CPCC 205316]|uniref:hypothetical protein n=1 Tax=Kocuria sp. CPCC 205316 TaxID=3073559 RepID=UPI0036D782F5
MSTGPATDIASSATIDGAGHALGTRGSLLDDRTTARVLGTIRGRHPASLPGVTLDRIPMALAVEIDALP